MFGTQEIAKEKKQIETEASQEPYLQQITLWYEGTVSKAGVLLGEREEKPVLAICSDQNPFALTGVEKPYGDVAAFIRRSEKLWDGGRNNQPFKVISREDMLKAQKSAGKIPIFNNHQNIPVTVLPLTSPKDYAAFLSVYFPSGEFLAMGSGQPKLIVSRARESKQRLDEILDEMAHWNLLRLSLLMQQEKPEAAAAAG